MLAFLPNILSALCLNNRGLQAFMACKPFDKLFKVLLSPDYLPAMRRRRSSDALGKKYILQFKDGQPGFLARRCYFTEPLDKTV